MLGALALAGLGGGLARAGEPCLLHLDPATDPAWREAAEAARVRLARRGDAGDCRAVEVVVRADGSASLAFVTTDGRVAERELQAPAELGPVLEALLVTLPPPEPARPDPPDTTTAIATKSPSPEGPRAPTSAAARRVEPTAPAATERVQVDPLDVRVELGAAFGARAVWQPAAFVAPTVGVLGNVQLERWYLGLGGSFSALHAPLDGQRPDGFRRTATAGALELGRAFELGPIGLDALGSIGVQRVEQSAGAARGERVSIDVAQAIAGARVRASWPRDERVRLLGGLGFDAVLGSRSGQSTSLRGLPPLARYGTGLELGVEFSCL
jgi:hypothetical protein